MKFKNFVKMLGGEGTIYEAPNGDKWLGGIVGTFTMMKIPSFNTGINAKNIKPMNFDLAQAVVAEPDCECTLTSARLEHPDGKAGEILRCFGC
ncbi:hypothetical protein, partial [Pseudomonas aeruginosa]|uniref:hypothetical protein n=1 Tax=Pseudomonas aeruginosa TaxID=287 RepID=UPI001F4B1CD6